MSNMDRKWDPAEMYGKMLLPPTPTETTYAQYPLQHAQKVIEHFVHQSSGITIICECFWNLNWTLDHSTYTESSTYELAVYRDSRGNTQVQPIFLNVSNKLALNFDHTTKSIIKTTLNEYPFRYSGIVMTSQYDDPASSLCGHILNTNSQRGKPQHK